MHVTKHVAATPRPLQLSSASLKYSPFVSFSWQYAEICCVHFVKRSQETGFSISVARPIGPATISLSEREQIPTTTTLRQLPPLRHTYGGRDPQKYTE
uniref:Uncharacterized protein n=1 Tax=Heterorhabditis bacteriophora TaxID=37862 RepID=A0A1I7XDB4_HETBA